MNIKLEDMPEDTVFTEAVGNYPITRVLGFLITGRESDFCISDIAEGADVGWTTLHYLLPELEEKELVKQMREVGRAKMYRINQENQVAQQLITLYDNLLNISVDKIIAEQQKAVAKH